MIIVFERDKAEGLQYALGHVARGAENFGHAMYRSRMGLKGNFDEVALRKRLGQLQQAAGHRNGLKFRFRAAAVFESNRSQDRISKLDPGRAPGGVRLGEVGHRSNLI